MTRISILTAGKSGEPVRYWKGVYDEDTAREGYPPDKAPGEEEGIIRWFHLMVVIQILLVGLVGLLFVTSR